jgi:hypothetical protein
VDTDSLHQQLLPEDVGQPAATVVTAAVAVPVSEPDYPLDPYSALCAKFTSLLALNAAELLSFVQKRKQFVLCCHFGFSFCYVVSSYFDTKFLFDNSFE